ncbi:tellurite resistance/C4-dicarboxylate transporter family protein [Streptomyces sp. NBC_00555]|uniref:tellurite resistance/C4-dicarboxylate transporter family protein n=1 Tax=Streptomyces sp. NBC_00555 TaxID=2903662 RepID=UPI00225262F0|nr:tellurite resistance/C4-dicarboxylate transporter family protein [Streptomyces sp. NBC_00555]MCX5010209.1 tellurite resistance/C4-dicarboxylate transporter family protein [Streptomyces sp. NBC_00555]
MSPPSSPPSGRAWWTGLPPAAGAAVMAAGILSVGLHLTGYEVLSLIALALSGALWLVLAADFTARLLGDRGRFRAEADTPAALTAVAATTVLGTRLSQLGWQSVAAALLALAAVLWPGLLLGVVRHWRRRMPGAAFLVCVATEGLTVLAATLAAAGYPDWLAWAALAAFCLGLLLYVAALVRFDLREVIGGAGDHWVAGGALSICALAGAKLTASPVWTGAAHTALRTATLIVLALSLVWYAVLLGAELRHPRPHYDIRRWATVFPLGMTATACLSAADPTGLPWLLPLGEVLLWIAVAAWLLTFFTFLTAHLTSRP